MGGKKHGSHYFKLHGIVFWLYFIVMAVILIMLLLSGKIYYPYKRSFLLENWILLCMGVVGAAVLYHIFCQTKVFCGKFHMDSDKMLSLLTKVLFFLQIYFCYNVYFRTGWDSAVVNNGAYELANGRPLSDVDYFSQCPNNLLMVYFFSLIKRVDMHFGILDVSEGIMCILCVQCLISSLTGFLLFKTVRNLIGCHGAWCAWLCYLVLVGSSGWLMIPYSDSVGLLFPVLILYLYQKIQSTSAGTYTLLYLRWLAVGVLSCFGYYIKPQIFIIFIAIVLTECMQFRSYVKLPVKKKMVSFAFALAGLLSTVLFYNIVMKGITENLDPERKLGVAHFVMMGLNTENNGGYLFDDVLFSGSFPTISERNTANVEVIGQRLRGMGGSGLMSHLTKKLLINYNDGTFAWENEGNFFECIYEPKNKFLSPLLRNIITGNGEMNLLSETVRQMVWLCILAASLGMAGYKSSADKGLCVVLWSLLGLTAFELLFEARARYLYIYVPLYIITGVLGARWIRMFLRLKRSRVAMGFKDENSF